MVLDSLVAIIPAGEKVQGVSPVAASQIFFCKGIGNIRQGAHSFVKLHTVIQGYACRQCIDGAFPNSGAGNEGGLGDAYVVPLFIRHLWGIVFFTRI